MLDVGAPVAIVGVTWRAKRESFASNPHLRRASRIDMATFMVIGAPTKSRLEALIEGTTNLFSFCGLGVEDTGRSPTWCISCIRGRWIFDQVVERS